MTCNNDKIFETLLDGIQKKIAETALNFNELLQISEQMVDKLRKEKCHNEQLISSLGTYPSADNIVTLNVGGQKFQTLRSTLAKKIIDRSSYDDAYYSPNMFEEFVVGGLLTANNDEEGTYSIFIDHNPRYFELVLDYLRTADTDHYFKIPKHVNRDELRRDALFYKMQGLIDLIDRENWYKTWITERFNAIKRRYFDFFQFVQSKSRLYNWKYSMFLLNIVLMTLTMLTGGQLGQDSTNKSIQSSTILNQTQVDDLFQLCHFSPEQEFSLLYRASEHGFAASAFHSNCDNKTRTLTIVKSIDGYIFGGYTNAEWDSYSRYKMDYNSFLFSLVNKYNEPSKLRVKTNYEMFSIYGDGQYGPTFGDSFVDVYSLDDVEYDLFISDNSNMNAKSYTKVVDLNYRNGRIRSTELPYYFQVVDLEVYQVL